MDISVTHADTSDPGVLYCHYQGQFDPQPCFIALDLEDGEFWASYNPEIGNGIPASVYHGRTLRWTIPCLTAEAANRLLDDAGPVAARVLAGAGIEWNGSNHVGVLSTDSQAAADEIEALCEARRSESLADSDVIQESDAYDWFTYASKPEIAAEYGITAGSSDAGLEAAAEKAGAEAWREGQPGPLVLSGTLAYFRDMRDELRAAAGTGSS